MSRKSKQKPVEETPAEPPPEPAPEEVPPVVPEEPPQPEPEPVKAQVEEEPAPQAPIVPQSDEELPPPPSDIAELTKKYPPLNPRKPGVGAALKRAGAIFGKDVSTMAKHGLVSSVILLVFLVVLFYISSFAMYMMVTTSMGDGDGDGDGGPNLQRDDSLIQGAMSDMPGVAAGTVLTFDSSTMATSEDIRFVEWRINAHEGQLQDDISLYGPQGSYLFDAVGQYEVTLTVVDINMHYDEDNLTVTVNVNNPSDTEQPMLSVQSTPSDTVMYGSTVTLDASNSTDNVGIVNYTWFFDDVIERVRFGPIVDYVFESTGGHQVSLIAKDASGNFARTGGFFQVNPNGPDDQWPNAQIGELPESVNIGDTVQLDASDSNDNQGIAEYTWYIKLNNTRMRLDGQQASFTAERFGMYEILLVVKDGSGNAGTNESGVLSLVAGMDIPSGATWTSTPLGQDVPFNVMTFVYGAAMLACVIFMGGLFSKGFAYEIQKGTAKTLFFAPISVTNMIFAKMLYPLAISPIFIFPLMLISTIPLHQDMQGVLMITLVSYLMTALIMASAAYGSCLLYAVTKRMSIKPTALARMFMYLSILATLTVFVGLAFLMDMWMTTDMWSGMYAELGSNIAMFSPFHQGGILISSMLLGTTQSVDWFVFAIPAVLIIAGALVSRKLFPDLFSRE